MSQRVELSLSLVMTGDRDMQNALTINLLEHVLSVADRFGVELTGGEAWAVVTPLRGVKASVVLEEDHEPTEG